MCGGSCYIIMSKYVLAVELATDRCIKQKCEKCHLILMHLLLLLHSTGRKFVTVKKIGTTLICHNDEQLFLEMKI